jgi:hypothetical protein
VELHQNSAVGNCEQLRLVVRAQILILYYVLLNHHPQELVAALVDVRPTLPLLAAVLPHALVLLVRHLLPSYQRLSLEDASALLPDDLGEDGGDLLQVLGLALDVLEGGDSPAQV